jgi:hypothetical protein
MHHSIHTWRIRLVASQISLVVLVAPLFSSRNALSISLSTDGSATRPASVFSAMLRNRLTYHLALSAEPNMRNTSSLLNPSYTTTSYSLLSPFLPTPLNSPPVNPVSRSMAPIAKIGSMPGSTLSSSPLICAPTKKPNQTLSHSQTSEDIYWNQ